MALLRPKARSNSTILSFVPVVRERNGLTQYRLQVFIKQPHIHASVRLKIFSLCLSIPGNFPKFVVIKVIFLIFLFDSDLHFENFLLYCSYLFILCFKFLFVFKEFVFFFKNHALALLFQLLNLFHANFGCGSKSRAELVELGSYRPLVHTLVTLTEHRDHVVHLTIAFMVSFSLLFLLSSID